MADDQEALRAIEAEIARLEIAREGLVHKVADRDEPHSGRRFAPDRSGPGRTDDLIQGEIAVPSAIDVFREQREAAEQLHGRVQEISALLDQLRHQVNSLVLNDDLRAMLWQEQDWLTRAQLAVSEVRSFREQDMLRFWPGVIRRWAVALIFALASSAAAGAGYAWWTKPYAAELAAVRGKLAFADFVENRVLTMTSEERRQFEALMVRNGRARKSR